jgi:hypothetical protein
LTVDDTTETSLYLTDDTVADALNNLYNAGLVSVTGAASPFPRPTGMPQVLHGDGSPEGVHYAPQGSLFMRRDGADGRHLYVKSTAVTISTGWIALPGQEFDYAATGKRLYASRRSRHQRRRRLLEDKWCHLRDRVGRCRGRLWRERRLPDRRDLRLRWRHRPEWLADL